MDVKAIAPGDPERSGCEWTERVPLGELARVFAGVPRHRLRGEASPRVPAVNVRDLDHALDPAWRLGTIPMPDVAAMGPYRLRAGDVLVTARGTRLNSALVPILWAGAVVLSNLIGVRPGPRLLPHILLAFLRSGSGRQAVDVRRPRRNQLALTPGRLREVEVPLPPLAVQDRLAKLARSAEAQYEAAIFAAEARRGLASRIIVAALRGNGAATAPGGIKE